MCCDYTAAVSDRVYLFALSVIPISIVDSWIFALDVVYVAGLLNLKLDESAIVGVSLICRC